MSTTKWSIDPTHSEVAFKVKHLVISTEGKISRKAFGLTWSAVTEAGSVVVGDDVKLLASIQLVKQ